MNQFNDKKITILMYHDVRDLHQTKYPNRYKQKSFMRNEDFSNQINYIKKCYTVISMDDLLSIINSNIPINKNYALLTFDDGLKDHVFVADFLYQSHINLSATFFIPTEPVLTRKMMKTHKIQFIIGEGNLKIISKKILSHFKKEKRQNIWNIYSTSSWKDNTWNKEQIFITNLLRKYPDKKKSELICNDLFETYVTSDEKQLADDLYLTMEDINKIISSNFTIGGHGYTSDNLLNFNNKEQYEDISKLTDFLNKIGVSKRYISYPNGGVDDNIIDITKKYGYSIGLATTNRIITNIAEENVLSLPRLDAAQKLIVR